MINYSKEEATTSIGFNLALKQIVKPSSHFCLVDGKKEEEFSGTICGILKPLEPFEIFLQGFFLISSVILFRIKDLETSYGQLSVSIGNLSKIHDCKKILFSDFDGTVYKINCNNKILVNKIILKTQISNFQIEEVEVYGKFGDEESKYFFPLGCLENLKIDFKTPMVSLVECVKLCGMKKFPYIALNLKTCGCIGNKPINGTKAIQDCDKLCPKSNHFCGKKDSFQVIDDKNLCIHGHHYCDLKKTECKYKVGQIKCFCFGKTIQVGLDMNTSVCNEGNVFSNLSFSSFLLVSSSFYYWSFFNLKYF